MLALSNFEADKDLAKPPITSQKGLLRLLTCGRNRETVLQGNLHRMADPNSHGQELGKR